MTSPPTSTFGSEQPHLVSLVLKSKKALQHGELLCSRARTRSVESAQAAVDVLALDAKVRWMTDAVLEQLKLAASVAKSLEQKRMQLESQAKEWDATRTQRVSTLDSVLESLGSQVVPPDFHSTSPDSSLFGSQHDSDNEDETRRAPLDPPASQSPTDTLRDVMRNGTKRICQPRNNDRSIWKTLRDFADERAIEDVLDAMESDRNTLDDILARISEYPELLQGTITNIRNSLPTDITLPPMDSIFASQEAVSTDMANHLSGLTSHYDQMAQALHDSEAGEEFGEDDIQAMNRDTEELPAIVDDLEKNMESIEVSHAQLLAANQIAQQQLDSHRSIMNDLDELGDIMSEMLEREQAVENECAEQLSLLHNALVTIEDLYHRYTSFHYSYCKLVIELGRRRRYREAANKVVQGMMAELEAMTEEENQRRVQFNAEHGEHLPEDVCLSIQNTPTRWEILPWNHEPVETLPDIDDDLLQQALNHVASVEGAMGSSQSL